LSENQKKDEEVEKCKKHICDKEKEIDHINMSV
jgi:hypothetical protein